MQERRAGGAPFGSPFLNNQQHAAGNSLGTWPRCRYLRTVFASIPDFAAAIC